MVRQEPNPPGKQETTMPLTRRTFMQTSAALVAAITLAPTLASSRPTSDKKIRIGIVGGNFGLQFFFHSHPNCIVHAVSDLRPERRAALMKTYRCEKSYDSLEQLVQDDQIDAVALFTPAPDHVNHVELCMKHGKHALSAVPAAVGSLDECHRLLDIVKSTGRTYMMAETSYYQQPTISARKFYNENAFGRLFYAESEYHHPGLGTLWFENGKRTWRY